MTMSRARGAAPRRRTPSASTRASTPCAVAATCTPLRPGCQVRGGGKRRVPRERVREGLTRRRRCDEASAPHRCARGGESVQSVERGVALRRRRLLRRQGQQPGDGAVVGGTSDQRAAVQRAHARLCLGGALAGPAAAAPRAAHALCVRVGEGGATQHARGQAPLRCGRGGRGAGGRGGSALGCMTFHFASIWRSAAPRVSSMAAICQGPRACRLACTSDSFLCLPACFACGAGMAAVLVSPRERCRTARSL